MGGRLRDAVLGTPPAPELDLAAPDPRALLAAWRRAPGEALVELDAARDTFRIVAPAGSRIAHVDLARLRGPSIEDDLRLRDFTVDALALRVDGERAGLVDPTGGATDCARRVLRACGPRSIADDPLRALRAARLAAALGLRIEPRTRALLRRGARDLPRVSAERVRDELFRIFQGPRPVAGVRLALDLGLLAPAGLRRRAPGPLPRLARAHRIVAAAGRRGPLGRALAEPLEQGVERRGIALLAALLRELRLAGRAATVAAALALGTRAARALAAAAAPLPPGTSSRAPRARRRALLELHRAAGDAWPETVAANAASAPAAEALARRHRAARRAFARPALLDGATAMRALGLPPGPALGALLAAARRAQDLGEVRTASGALRRAARARRAPQS